jgi:hypothetical protein
MTLLAEEPLVTDPVAICYDADGRAYVAEMNDYPYTDKAKHLPMRENQTDQAIGKIRLLTDVDGDGVFDKSSVFANGLSWPSGVVPWQGGVFVTAAPDFWYFKDTDDDGVADVRQKITSGFRKYNVQSAVNTPVWGLDNRIYIATARNKGDLSFGSDDTKGRTALPGGRDLRIDPRTLGEFVLVRGGIRCTTPCCPPRRSGGIRGCRAGPRSGPASIPKIPSNFSRSRKSKDGGSGDIRTASLFRVAAILSQEEATPAIRVARPLPAVRRCIAGTLTRIRCAASGLLPNPVTISSTGSTPHHWGAPSKCASPPRTEQQTSLPPETYGFVR